MINTATRGTLPIAELIPVLVLLLLLLADNALSSPLDARSLERKAKATQYHTQDPTSGTYQYGYTGPHHAKTESNFDGVTRGGYSYIDANGLMQTVSYTADADNGFRVQASNLPNPNPPTAIPDTPEVALAKKRHLEQLRKLESWQQSQQEPRQQLQRQYHQQLNRYNSRNPFLLTPEEARSIPAPRPSNAVVLEPTKNNVDDDDDDDDSDDDDDDSGNNDDDSPIKLAAARRRFSTSSLSSHPRHFVIPAASIYAMPLPFIHSSMRHAQDSLGQYEYSYTGDTSAKTESRSLDGTTRGAYSYIDANGLLQQVHYIADRDGFRVLATNLPEA